MIIRRKNYLYPGIFRAYARHLAAGELVAGPSRERFEAAFTRSIGVPFGTLTSCGTHALMLALEHYRAVGSLPPDAEILIPAFTTYIVPELLDYMGVRYRTIDILPGRTTMDAADLEAKVGPATRAVLVTHLMGNMCDLAVLEVCRRRGLLVIEDCAQVHGARWSDAAGTPAGGLGDAAFYSFGYNKIITSCNGGILLTRDAALHAHARRRMGATAEPTALNVSKKLFVAVAENVMTHAPFAWALVPFLKHDAALKRWKRRYNHFAHDQFDDFRRLSNVQAAWALEQLDALPETLERRMRQERALEADAPVSVSFVERRPGDVSYLVIARVSDASACREALFRAGIDTGIGTTIMEAFGGVEGQPGLARSLATYVQLPAHFDLSERAVELIRRSLSAFAHEP